MKLKVRIKGIGIAIGCFLLFQVLPILLVRIIAPLVNKEVWWQVNIAMLATEFGTFLIFYFLFHKKINYDFKEFIKNPRLYLKQAMRYWFYGLVVMAISNIILSGIIGDIAANEDVTRALLFSDMLYALPTVIIFAPCIEEIVFRLSFRFPFQKENSYALCSAFVFGGLHVLTAFDFLTLENIVSNWMQIFYIIPYGALGYFFAKIYYQTDNIFSTISIHILHNTISVILIFLSFLIERGI